MAAAPVMQTPVRPTPVKPPTLASNPVMQTPVRSTSVEPAALASAPVVPAPSTAVQPATGAPIAPAGEVPKPLEILSGNSMAAASAAQAFKRLIERASKDRDMSGRMVSFQYTLCVVAALVVVVTVVGVILLQHATAKQRTRTTAKFSVAPGTTKHGSHRVTYGKKPEGFMEQENGDPTPDDSFTEDPEPLTVPSNVALLGSKHDAGTHTVTSVEDAIDDESAALDAVSNETTSSLL